jgi:hypothetical protein
MSLLIAHERKNPTMERGVDHLSYFMSIVLWHLRLFFNFAYLYTSMQEVCGSPAMWAGANGAASLKDNDVKKLAKISIDPHPLGT